MPLNKNLNQAKQGKKDEFYTQLADIENELRHYKDHFKGKVVYCNCDDPTVSNFFKYFSLKFSDIEMKKLVTTCYKNQNPDLFSSHDSERAIRLEYDGFRDGDRVPNVEDIGVTHLKGDGDFRSQECIDILKQADIIATNPPFSLFREYVPQLMEYGKKFIIIGNQNAITFREIFPWIKESRLWLGHGFNRNCAHFISNYTDHAIDLDKKEGMIRVPGVFWFTNLDHAKRHEDLILYRRYTPEDYPTYDNYHAIEVSKTKNIPMDYDGVMGVPITFLDKHNPDQFELLGATESEGKGFSGELWRPESGIAQAVVHGRRVYKRLFVRNKNPEKQP